MIELTKDQEDGRKKTIEWYNALDRKQIWKVSGAAGTGKTTMIYSLIDSLGLSQNEVAFATYTGKAALVLTMRGCPATTIHKLIYEYVPLDVPVLDSEGNQLYDEEGNEVTKEEMSFIKRDALDSNIKLLVLDECSMIDDEMMNDLLSFDLPIIILGDAYQLPPIKKSKLDILENPDVVLNQIMRQKEDDPIVFLATKARHHEKIYEGQYGKSYVIPRREIDMSLNMNDHRCDKILSNSDIVLCRTNKTRNSLNGYMREEIFGITKKLPTLNDKLICRRNNWDLTLEDFESDINLNLVNGLIGYVNSPITSEDIDMSHSCFFMDFKPEVMKDNFFERIPASTIPFINATEDQKKIFEYNQYRFFKNRKEKCNTFEYAYAITVHLSQGSSWRRVLVYDEQYGDDYFNSLYTAITRAETQVIIAKDRI